MVNRTGGDGGLTHSSRMFRRLFPLGDVILGGVRTSMEMDKTHQTLSNTHARLRGPAWELDRGRAERSATTRGLRPRNGLHYILPRDVGPWPTVRGVTHFIPFLCPEYGCSCL